MSNIIQIRQEIIKYLNKYYNPLFIHLNIGYHIELYYVERRKNFRDPIKHTLVDIVVSNDDNEIKVDSSIFNIFNFYNDIEKMKNILDEKFEHIYDYMLPFFIENKSYNLNYFPIINFKKFVDFLYYLVINYDRLDEYHRFNIIEEVIKMYNTNNWKVLRPLIDEKLGHLIHAHNFDLI